VEAHAAAVREIREGEGVQRFDRKPARWMRYAVAAVLIGLLGWGIVLLVQRESASKRLEAPASALVLDVAAPVANRARITLANGQQLYLDSAGKGHLAQQAGAQVVKLDNGQVAYLVGLPNQNALLYNTLTNPRGSRVVTLTLSDGTKVWLNAESSIRYPAVFVGNNREVSMTGEAYFEVAKDAARPFLVSVAEQERITVLGTHFDINAYDDETFVRSTLLEGSVSVGALLSGPAARGLVLRPGEQAVLARNRAAGSGVSGGLRLGTDVDTAAVMAWKNGRFAYKHADLPTVMRQLARWYDVEVSYEGTIPDQHFSGGIGSELSLNQVLKVLTNSRVRYRIEGGNKLVIRP
jgi:transmembrane sensor